MQPLLQLLAAQTATVGAALSSTSAVSNPYTQITEYFSQTDMYLVAGAIYLLPLFLRQLPFLKTPMANQWVVRVMPLYPLIAAYIATYLPGALSLPDSRLGTRLVATIWLAGLSTVMYKIIGQTVLGDDPRIKTLAVESQGQYASIMSKESKP